MDITQVLAAAITLLAALITTFLVPYIKSKLTTEKVSLVNSYVTIAVGAAEQLFNSDEGRAKKDYVLHYLEEKGIALDMETIDIMIENAVLQLHAALKD